MRLTLGAAALIAIGAATFFLIRSEAQVTSLSSSVRRFDSRAREGADALSEVRAGQQAYAAAGQSTMFWTAKVSATMDRARVTIAALRQSAQSASARRSLMEAEATVAELMAVDTRAREYLTSNDVLMAADIVFAEGAGAAVMAARQVETARVAEWEWLDDNRAAIRRQQAAALVATAGVVAAVMLVVAAVPQRQRRPKVDARAIIPPASPALEPLSLSRSPSFIAQTADLCTEFGRVRDVDDLKRTLERAAELIDAKGLIVWLGSTAGADLQPVVAHGYTAQVVMRLPTVPKSAENAAAAAYRTGIQQIVLSRSGRANGAIVAPILTADGCVGALSAEVDGGSEGSERAQTLLTIVAAQLAAMFAATGSADAEPRKSAQA